MEFTGFFRLSRARRAYIILNKREQDYSSAVPCSCQSTGASCRCALKAVKLRETTMKNTRRNVSKVIFCIWLLVALYSTGAEALELSKGVTAARDIIIADKNRHALEAYEKRNAEITPWAGDSVLTNTDNAALLYYQACLFVPEPNEALRYKIRPNAGPTTQIRTYLGYCLPVIEMVETASRIPGCIWGAWPKGYPDWAPLRRKMFLLSDILLVDAGILAVDGHYRVALERCLTVRRIARHLGHDPELYIYEVGFDRQALYMIRILLGMIPPDTDILTWFRGQFTTVQEPHVSFAKKFRGIVKIELDAMRTHPDYLRGFRNTAIMEAEGEQAKENLRNLTDEQFRLRARDAFDRLADSILRILDNEASCNQQLIQINEVIDQIMMEDDATAPISKSIVSRVNLKGQINVAYTRAFIDHEAHVNGTKAAVEVYLILAKTGKLPEKLPEHLPKNPFTGQDFEYEITDEGFVIRCESNEFLPEKEIVLEFRVRK